MGNRILAIEDSPTQAARLAADLEAAGFDVEMATSGEAALARVAGDRFDLVLSDVVMPGIDGYETCRRIKARDADVPVVLLTSLDDPVEIVRGLEAGADSFLRKPYEPQQLAARLWSMLARRELRATETPDEALDVVLRGRRFTVNAERQQILDLLISSFEDLVESNTRLRERDEALTAARDELERQLEATERERSRVATLLGAAPEPMVIVDDQGRVTDASEQFAALVRCPVDDLLGRSVWDRLRLVDANGEPVSPAAVPLAAALRGDEEGVELGGSFDLFVELDAGERIAVLARSAPVRDATGQVVAAVGSFHEIGSLAAHDAVTTLPNQVRFADHVAEALSDDRGDEAVVGVLAIVLDRFRLVTEHVPVEVCNGLLAEFSSRLRRAATADVDGAREPTPVVGYLGGDAFTVLVTGGEDELAAVRFANQLLERLSHGWLSSGNVDLPLRVSIGVAVGRPGSSRAVDLLAVAAASARRASAAGGGRLVIADPGVDARAETWLREQAELRAAIDEGQLVLHYQPHVDLQTGRPTGVEALVRWRHPTRGLLRPDQFLPLAAESGLVVPLGWWVLDEACRQAAIWRRSLPDGDQLLVSVNLDAAQLADPELTEQVAGTLASTGLGAHALVLEITERGMMDDVEVAAARLRQLKALGVRLAVDDFGTGYSSLAHLRAFPVDLLKIDQSFVAGMATQPEDAAIVSASVRLARSLGLDTVAEGVEAEGQLAQLRLLGCDFGQGYHWSAPLPADELAEWWAAAASAAKRRRVVLPMPIEQDASTAMDEALAYLIHELRTPLTSIVAYADLAARVPDQQAAYLEIIARNARDLDSRITLLAEARSAGEGAMGLQPVEVQLAETVHDLLHDLQPQLADRTITVESDEETPARVDPMRFRQALTNLLTNAAKFSPPDTAIEVSVNRVDRGVEVAVRDHGPGVPAERRPELFRRFARLGAREKGMGVGLYLARAIARAHGGDARFEPAPGGGATFVLAVPAADDAQG